MFINPCIYTKKWIICQIYSLPGWGWFGETKALQNNVSSKFPLLELLCLLHLIIFPPSFHYDLVHQLIRTSATGRVSETAKSLTCREPKAPVTPMSYSPASHYPHLNKNTHESLTRSLFIAAASKWVQVEMSFSEAAEHLQLHSC